MIRTEFAVCTTEELINFALLRDNRTSMEIELAQRLMLAIDKIERMEPPEE